MSPPRETWQTKSSKTPVKVSAWDAFIARLFPPACPACLGRGEPDADFCRACRAELPALGRSCALCAGVMSDTATPGAICGRCLAQPPAFDRVFAALRFATPMSDVRRGV